MSIAVQLANEHIFKDSRGCCKDFCCIQLNRRLSLVLTMDAGFLREPDVKRYLTDVLEADIIDPLHENNLIDDEDKNRILQKITQADKVALCVEILGDKQALDIERFYETLKEADYNETVNRLQEIAIKGFQHDTSNHNNDVLRLGNTCVFTINSTTPAVTTAIHQSGNSTLNQIVQANPSGITIYVNQPGCIEIFFHSKLHSIYDEVSKQSFCREITEKFFTLKNVHKTLKNGQKVKITVTKDPYSFPLKDNKGNILREFTKSLLDTEETDKDKKWDNFLSSFNIIGESHESDRFKKMSCIECCRSTIKSNFKTVLDEIDTNVMKRTFEDKDYIPKVVIDDCIHSKGKQPRITRAQCFLEYVLIKGEVFVSFAEIFSSMTNAILKFTPCEHHSAVDNQEQPHTSQKEEIEFNFTVYQDEKGIFQLRMDEDVPNHEQDLSLETWRKQETENYSKKNSQNSVEVSETKTKKQKVLHENPKPNGIIY